MIKVWRLRFRSVYHSVPVCGECQRAAVLKALNQIYNEVLSTQQPIDIEPKSSDVPFSLSRDVVMSGIGSYRACEP